VNKEELHEKFYSNIEYLQQNIPPDDIYLFTEQTFMACLYFLKRWSDCEDLDEVCKNDPIAEKWIVNVVGFQRLKEDKIPVQLDLDLKSIED